MTTERELTGKIKKRGETQRKTVLGSTKKGFKKQERKEECILRYR